ncbi:MAG: hypothetical protein A3F33_01405 [Candidatus Woykebacteria bacterium RIFCSPHIGHO2_12_FULL_43_10]|nr:MAG: hypothetical protein A3F33_01405 [Candidatus Woykebacteria bacterium RIFCSPHIGHO2_12_FULL_43_10]
MRYVADLHLHSKYSRAVSPQMTIPTMAKWGKIKGIDLFSSSDFTHPAWFSHLKEDLQDDGNGFYTSKTLSDPSVKFILGTEISCIYRQNGKTRRVHLLVYAPDLATVEKINMEFGKRGNIRADGRPILGLSAIELTEIVLGINAKCFIIPAHCLKPETLIHTKEGVKKISDIKVGDFVYTHKNRARKVTDVLVNYFKGDLYHIKPWYFSLGLATTPEHPFYAFKVTKCSTTGDKCLPTPAHKRICKNKLYKLYKPAWIQAKSLGLGDILVFPRFQNTTLVEQIPLDISDKYKTEGNQLYSGGTRGRAFSKLVSINADFCRLIGYYLAEGYTNSRDEVAFAFHLSEEDYVEDVIKLMKSVFGLSHHRKYIRNNTKGIEISFYSKLLVEFFTKTFYVRSPYNATTKTLPDFMIHLPTQLNSELFRGWWRGDKGYTSSVDLMNGMKAVCLRLGIVPSITKDSKVGHLNRGNHNYLGREIKASTDGYAFSHLAFYEDPYNLLLDKVFKNSVPKLSRKHGWIDEDYIYIPIREMSKYPYDGEVFNLEVEEDNSYLAEFATVHNCWTPWFSLYGSNSGFDHIDEAFGKYSKEIFAVETGLSSDPVMNWRLSQLDDRAIVSFSDAHSPAKMGREATIIDGELSYQGLVEALKSQSRHSERSEESPVNAGTAYARDPSPGKPVQDDNKVIGTIEFFPEEGKYHYNGHRVCGVTQHPKETKENGETCPVCGRRLTVGVMQRVEELADRSEEELELTKENGWLVSKKYSRPGFRRLVPLAEIVAEALGTASVSTKKVIEQFDTLINNLGNEIDILLHAKREDIEKYSSARIAEGVEKVRIEDIVIDPGFDGLYGIVKIWPETKRERKFDPPKNKKEKEPKSNPNQDQLTLI